MNAAERQALREKHSPCPCGFCEGAQCVAGCISNYPCDVIKVLNELEMWVKE
jgi:hypothetical protein